MGLVLRDGNYTGFMLALFCCWTDMWDWNCIQISGIGSLLRSFPTSLLLWNWGFSLVPLIAQGPLLWIAPYYQIQLHPGSSVLHTDCPLLHLSPSQPSQPTAEPQWQEACLNFITLELLRSPWLLTLTFWVIQPLGSKYHCLIKHNPL